MFVGCYWAPMEICNAISKCFFGQLKGKFALQLFKEGKSDQQILFFCAVLRPHKNVFFY